MAKVKLTDHNYLLNGMNMSQRYPKPIRATLIMDHAFSSCGLDALNFCITRVKVMPMNVFVNELRVVNSPSGSVGVHIKLFPKIFLSK